MVWVKHGTEPTQKFFFLCELMCKTVPSYRASVNSINQCFRLFEHPRDSAFYASFECDPENMYQPTADSSHLSLGCA